MINTTGVFLGASLANLLTQLPKDKANVIVLPTGSSESELVKFLTPTTRYAGYVTCGAGANFFSPDIEPINKIKSCLFRVQIALSVAGVFSVVLKEGSASSTYSFNAGVALVANAIYTFDVLVTPNNKINFQSSLAGIANIHIQEINVGIQ